jgi:hypothetical protein
MWSIVPGPKDRDVCVCVCVKGILNNLSRSMWKYFKSEASALQLQKLEKLRTSVSKAGSRTVLSLPFAWRDWHVEKSENPRIRLQLNSNSVLPEYVVGYTTIVKRRFFGDRMEYFALTYIESSITNRTHDGSTKLTVLVTYCENIGTRYSVVGRVIRIRAGRSAVRIPAGAIDSFLLQNVQTSCRAHPASYLIISGVPWRRQSGRRVKLTNHLHLASRLKMYEAIPSHAFTAWAGTIYFTLLWKYRNP